MPSAAAARSATVHTPSAPFPDGCAIVTGSFVGTPTFRATTLNGAGSGDAFVARISADGAW
jgi:hypothetical protein